MSTAMAFSMFSSVLVTSRSKFDMKPLLLAMFFFTKWSSPIQILSEILQKLPHSQRNRDETISKGRIITSVRALAEIGSLPEEFSAELVEGHCTFLLCEFYLDYPRIKSHILRALKRIDMNAKFSSGGAILFHFHTILPKWIHAQRRLENFPFHLAGFETPEEFYCKAASVLLPECILVRFRSLERNPEAESLNPTLDIASLMTLVGASRWKEIQSSLYPSTVAYLLQLCTPHSALWDAETEDAVPFRKPGCFVAVMKQAIKAVERLPDFFGGDFNPVTVADDIILQAFHNMIVGKQPAACRSFDPNTSFVLSEEEQINSVKFCLKTLAERSGKCPRDILLEASQDSMQRILLLCLGCLVEGPKEQVKERSLDAIKILMSNDLFGHPSPSWFFHHVVGILLRSLSCESLLSRSIPLLTQIFETQSENESTSSIFSTSDLLDIIHAVVPFAQKGAIPGCTDLFSPLLSCLFERIISSGTHTLPVLPSGECFLEANAMITANFSVRDEQMNAVKLLLDHNGKFPDAVLEIYLECILAKLKHQEPNGNIFRPNDSFPSFYPILLNKFLDLARDANPKSKICELLGQCIACVSISLKPRMLPTDIDPDITFTCSTPSYYIFQSPNRKFSFDSLIINLCSEIIERLKMYIQSESTIEIVVASSDLLKVLLASGGPISINKSEFVQDPSTKTFIIPYTCVVPSHLPQCRPQEIPQFFSVASIPDHIWKCDASYEAWVCKLCSTLAKFTDNRSVHYACSHLCSICTPFAEILFPHVLLELIRTPGVSAVNVSRKFQEQILMPVDSNISAVRLVLCSLEFLNAFRCGVVLGQNEAAAVQVRGWKTCYGLEISYDIAAQAALRVGSPLTSIMFLERQVEEVECVKSEETHAREPSVPYNFLKKPDKMSELMIRALEQIDEPDGVLAFDKYLDLESVSKSVNRQDEWWRSLGYFDMSVGDRGHPGRGPCQELLSSMKYGGLTSLPMILTSHSNDEGAENEGIHFEMLWRAEKWDDRNIGSSCARVVRAGTDSFHWCLHRILSICSSGSMEDPNLGRYLHNCRLAAMSIFCERGRQSSHSIQSVKTIIPDIVRLRMVEDVAAFIDILASEKDPEGRVRHLRAQLYDWQTWYRDFVSMHDFTAVEPVMSLHRVMLSVARCDPLREEQLTMVAKYAMKCDNLSYARSAMNRIQTLKQKCQARNMSPSRSRDAWCLRLAKLYWREGMQGHAQRLLEGLCDQLNHQDASEADQDSDRLLAQSLALKASCWASSRSKGWSEVRVEFDESLRKYENYRVRAKLAAFMDAQYMAEKARSEERQTQLRQLESENPRNSGPAAVQLLQKQDRAALHCKQGLLERERNERIFLILAMENYLRSLERTVARCPTSRSDDAATSYSSSCHKRDRDYGNSQAVFRLLHLWLDDGEGDDQVGEVILAGIQRLLSTSGFKAFRVVAPQIISRLGRSKGKFQQAVKALVKHLLDEFPQETVFLLLATSKNKDTVVEGNEQRAEAAGDILAAFSGPSDESPSSSKRGTGNLKDATRNLFEERRLFYQQAQDLTDAYIELAEKKTCTSSKQRNPDEVKFTTVSIGLEYDLTPKLRRLKWSEAESKVAVPTCDNPDREGAYRVGKFKEKWVYPGGVTMPKQIFCIPHGGEKGMFIPQLVKGEDPRADATASQLFRVANILFSSDRACRRRALSIRTYRVVPLHSKAAIIEWVTDASSLRSILTAEPSNLRLRYDPKGLRYDICTNLIEKPQADLQRFLRTRVSVLSLTRARQNVGQGASQYAFDEFDTEDHTAEKKVLNACKEALDKIFKATRPVMRHFFLDRSSVPADWFRRRLAYTRSLAASSMAGYIVGLGDRHLTNMLLCEDTGEVVHIDLGIVFDQGQNLPLPEYVPFRLTRELVDGMGAAGTEGVYTRCCEETMRVMREHRQALLAVVDVLVHDPLIDWRLVADKKATDQRQNLDGGVRGGGVSATKGVGAGAVSNVVEEKEEKIGEKKEHTGERDGVRVRNRVREKLEGWENGEVLSVEGQVQKLIHDAQSIDRWAYLFKGWAAWL
mmetsp:Transcript_1537/g.4162  ORF Transcript_1537/g.4162 Transcript_1537/m.4162 type:complete len:2043 (+) Transcript_1537:628-6756(+)